MDATVTTSSVDAGEMLQASWSLLPAAETKIIFSLELKAFVIISSKLWEVVAAHKLMLTIDGFFGILGSNNHSFQSGQERIQTSGITIKDLDSQ